MYNYLDSGTALAPPPPEEEDEDLSDQEIPGSQDENEQMLDELQRPRIITPPPSGAPAYVTDYESPFSAPPASRDYQVFRETKVADQPRILTVPTGAKRIAPLGIPSAAEPIGAPSPVADYMPEPDAMPAPAPRIVGHDTTYAGALKTLAQLEAQRPQMTPPKWWQRGISAGLGAAAGYSNAARRAAPINISPAAENILHPGYQSKLEEWQSKVVPAQAQAEILSQQLSSERASQIAQSQEQLRQAQAIAAMQHGGYWQSRSEQERNQWKIDPKSGNLLNTINGQVVPKAPTPQDRYDTAIALHATPEEAKQYALGGKLPTVPAARVPAISTSALAVRALGGTTGNPQIDAMEPKAAKAAIDAAKDRMPPAPAEPVDPNVINGKQVADEGKILQQRQNDIIRVQNTQGSMSSDQKQAAINNINATAALRLQGIHDTSRAARLGIGLTGDAVQDYQWNVDPTGNLVKVPRVQAGTNPQASVAPQPVAAPSTQSPVKPAATPSAPTPPTSAQPKITPLSPSVQSSDTYTDPVSKKTYSVGQVVDINGTPVRIAEIRNGVPHGLPVYKVGDIVSLQDGKHRVNAVDSQGNALSVEKATIQ